VWRDDNRVCADERKVSETYGDVTRVVAQDLGNAKKKKNRHPKQDDDDNPPKQQSRQSGYKTGWIRSVDSRHGSFKIAELQYRW